MTFKEHKLAELCDIVSSKRVFAASYQSEGVPFFRGKEVSQLARGEKTTAELYISEEVYTDVVSRTGPINSGDILLTAVGTLGNPYQVKESDLPFYFKDGNIVWLRKFSKEINSTYLFYWLNSEYGRRKVLDTAIGSTQAALTITGLSAISMSCPSLSRQTGIVRILSAIDQKLALNYALSKTLEDIAQTIFKSWFIDFDPVKAKMAGEKPAGMDAATAALFPDSMEESELGLIPKGWEHKKVEEILKRITVKGLPKSTVLLNLGRTLVLEQGDSVIAGFIDDAADVEASMESPAFVFGDHTCRMRLSTMPFSIFPNTIVLTSELINTYWAFGATWGLQKFETYRRHWMELAYKVLIVPNTEIANVYGERVKPLFEIIDSLTVQNRVLSALRDDLLPRLISGELQIPEEMLAS
jgi:type I restriction enzyme S subunit